MPKQRTSDHIYTLHTLIQKHVQQKKQGKIFGCFIDFQKAFDSVWHNGLFLKLIESGIGGRTYDIIKDIYNGNKCCVKINDKRTYYFSQTKGVRQGCSFSPTLFNIYINELASALDKSSCPGLTLEGREIKCLLYADDLLLLSPHEEGLHQSLSNLEKYSNDWALPINMEKSKIMLFQKKPRLADKKYNVLNIFLGCEGKREEKKKMHVLIYFIDLFLFYVLYNHLFLIHVMDNALTILCKSCQ